MIFWVLIIFVTIFSILFLLRGCSSIGGRFIFYFLAFFLSIFSGLRDGLGTDYYNYFYGLEWKSEVQSYNEYGYFLIANFVNRTAFSEILFFLLMAFLTIFSAFGAYKQSKNLSLTLFIFVFYPLIFFGTFNLVRQFAAAAIFLYALTFFVGGSYFRFLVLSVVACSLHASAIIFYFLLPFLMFNISSLLHVGVVFFSIIIPHFLVLDYGRVLDFFGVYYHYSDYEFEVGSNITIYVFSLFYVYLLLRVDNEVFKDKFVRIYTNMSTLFLVLVNLSVSFYMFYRLSILFILAIPLVFALSPKTNIEKIFFSFILILFVVVMFVYFLFSGYGNSAIIPENLFTPRGLID